jgi:hypothetical protein
LIKKERKYFSLFGDDHQRNLLTKRKTNGPQKNSNLKKKKKKKKWIMTNLLWAGLGFRV